jgi:hypothetical protein
MALQVDDAPRAAQAPPPPNAAPPGEVWPELGDLRPSRDPDPLVPPGEYHASCESAAICPMFGGRLRLVLAFRIRGYAAAPCVHAGKIVRMYATLPPRDKHGHFRHGVALSSKFYRAWVVARGGVRPRRRDRMSLDPFKNGLFLVRVRTVDEDSNQDPLPPVQRYSVIDAILERLA